MVDRYSDALDGQLEMLEYWGGHEGQYRFSGYVKQTGGPLIFLNNQFFTENDRSNLDSYNIIINTLLLGRTHYISSPICNFIHGASKNIPENWVLNEELIPHLTGFMWLGKGVDIGLGRMDDGTFLDGGVLKAISWVTTRATYTDERTNRHKRRMLSEGLITDRPRLNDDDDIHINFFVEYPKSPIRTLYPFFRMCFKLKETIAEALGSPYGENINIEDMNIEDYEGDKRIGAGALKFFVTFLLFIHQRILVTNNQRPDRSTRKRMAKSETGFVSTQVNAVTLRRVENKNNSDQLSQEIDWQCQWVVDGHWRNQYYLSTDSYRPLWINSYLKGPEDKPLRESTKIFNVRR